MLGRPSTICGSPPGSGGMGGRGCCSPWPVASWSGQAPPAGVSLRYYAGRAPPQHSMHALSTFFQLVVTRLHGTLPPKTPDNRPNNLPPLRQPPSSAVVQDSHGS